MFFTDLAISGWRS